LHLIPPCDRSCYEDTSGVVSCFGQATVLDRINDHPSTLAMLSSLYVDFNSYFASVEQQEHEQYRGKPIAVVPVMADTTCAIAASYEAKRFGVRTGTIIGDAKKMCPDLILVPARHGKYIEYHNRLVEAVESAVHVRRVMSIDEMVCDLTGSARQRAKAEAIALDVKKAIADKVGPYMKCSIGIAPNDFLAKTASDLQKPDGLVVIEREDLPHILYSMELRDICGIGRNMHKRLWKHGIYTVEMLCNAPKEKLHAVWGGIEGDRFWAKLRGEQVPFNEPNKTTVGHSHVLPPRLRTQESADGVMHRLLQKAAMRLRKYGLLTANLDVRVRYVAGDRWKCDMDLTPTQDIVQLTGALARMFEQRPVHDGAPFFVAVSLNKLIPAGMAPVPMFEHTGPSREALNTTIDKLNLKYGRNTVYLGGAHNALDSAPMRIAFTHIPDVEIDDEEEDE